MTAYTGGMPTFTSGVKTGNADRLNQLRDLGRAFTDAWSAYPPTITATSGTPTTVTSSGRWMQAGKLAVVRLSVTITTVGSAAGAIFATLPVAPLADYSGLGVSHDSASSGGQAVVFGGKLWITRYDGASFWVNGKVIYAQVAYEAA